MNDPHNNRSIDLSDLLSRIHRQASLVGGPHDGRKAPLPPLIFGDEHPRHLCQPGRGADETWYHYRLHSNATYVYVDHCDTLITEPHHPAQVDEAERQRRGPERLLFIACALIVAGCSATVVGVLVGYLVSVFL